MPKNHEALDDVAGRALHLDDIVASNYGGRPQLFLMKVIGFSAKQIRLELLEDVHGKTWDYSKGEQVSRFPHSVALVKTHDGRLI